VTAGPRLDSGAGSKVRDEGSVTIWLVAAGLVVVLVATGFAVAGAAFVARHRAQAAADLAALAGSMRALDGEEAACERAADVSARNGARMVACQLDELDLIVTVEVAPALLAKMGSARASARAGPVAGDAVQELAAANDHKGQSTRRRSQVRSNGPSRARQDGQLVPE
jgi:secretion/DNA translocation related TadE-like protein